MIESIHVRRWMWMLVLLLVATPLYPASAQQVTLTVRGTSTAVVYGQQVAAARQGEVVIFSGAGYAADEAIGLWQTLPNGAVVSLDGMRADSQRQFTGELRLRPTLATGLQHLSARGRQSGREATAAVLVLPGQGSAPTPGAQLLITPRAVPQLETISLTASGLRPGEPVAFWLTLPDGAVVGLDQQAATSNGAVNRTLTLPGFLPVGRYAVTAQGIISLTTAISEFTLQYGNGLNVPGARLAVNLGATVQGTVLDLVASGFAVGEEIAIWQTLPNGAVASLGTARADKDGALQQQIVLSANLPLGIHYFSIRGSTSNQVGFGRLVIESGA